MNRETLIIDDDPIICLLHQRLCEANGLPYSKTFCRASDALSYLLKNNSEAKNFIILLDINMPGMNGWQFLEALQKEELLAGIYLVLVTSSIDRADLERSRNFPLVNTFISKPLTTELVQTLLKEERLLEYL